MTQISRKTFPEDANARAYFSRVKLTPNAAEVLMNGMRTENELASELANIDGVTIIEVHAWSVFVQKSPVFNWEEIEPSILRLLSAFHLPLESSNLLKA